MPIGTGRLVKALAVGAVVALLCGCSTSPSTTLRSSWADPGVTAIDFRKVVVVFMNREQVTRQTAEEQLVGQIGPSRAVASYTIFAGSEAQDVEGTKRKLREAGFDGAVVMRMTGDSQDVSFEVGIPYSGPYASFYGYHGWGWTTVYQPDYLKNSSAIGIRTNLYDLEADKLVWSGLSESFHPRNATEMVRDAARALGDELRRKKLIS